MEHVFRYDRDTAIVETTAGKVRGFQYDGINIFKGIPYARAKRWHMPEPTEPFEGEFDATSYGYVCKIPTPGKPNNEMLVPHRYWPMSEDCLNLNIWTPGTDDKKRPVMVWIHGGGFRDGSAIEHDAYDGFNSAKYGDMVFVSINHRLNVIGYLDLSAFGEEYADVELVMSIDENGHGVTFMNGTQTADFEAFALDSGDKGDGKGLYVAFSNLEGDAEGAPYAMEMNENGAAVVTFYSDEGAISWVNTPAA